MTAATLVAGTVLSALVGLVYLHVGRRLARRRVSGSSHLAFASFVAWWYGLAGVSLIGAATTGATALGLRDLPLHLTITYALFLALYAALGALAYYLLYLYTGRRRAWVLPAVFYAGLYLWTVYLVQQSRPVAVEAGRWGARLVYGNQIPPDAPVVFVFLLLLVVPTIAAALAYATLWFRVEDREQRWRIGVVSASLVVWFGSALLASALDISQSDAWQVASRLVGLAAALAILAAFEPPRWVRKRLEVGSRREAPG